MILLFGDSHVKYIQSNINISTFKFPAASAKGLINVDSKKKVGIKIIDIIKSKTKNVNSVYFWFGFVDIVFSYYYNLIKNNNIDINKFIDQIIYNYLLFMLYIKKTFNVNIHVISVLYYPIIRNNNIIDNIILNISDIDYNDYKKYMIVKNSNSLFEKKKLKDFEIRLKNKSLYNYNKLKHIFETDVNLNKLINLRIITFNNRLEKICINNNFIYCNITSKINLNYINKYKTTFSNIDHHYIGDIISKIIITNCISMNNIYIKIYNILISLKNDHRKINVNTGNYILKEIDYVRKPFNFKNKNILNNKLSSITNDIKNYIEYNITEKTSNIPLPSGLCIFNSIYTENYLNKIHDELEKTYYFYKDKKTFGKYKISKLFVDQEKRKRTFMFDNLNVYDFLSVSFMMNNKLGVILFKYVSDIFKIYKIEDKYIETICKNSKIVIARYKSYTGLYVHIDKLRRGDGPVITMSLGPDENIYDLIPLDNIKKSIRVYFKKGSIVSMNGEIRYEWAHALPYGYKYNNNKPRYSIIFLMHNFKDFKIKYSNILKNNIKYTIGDCKDYIN